MPELRHRKLATGEMFLTFSLLDARCAKRCKDQYTTEQSVLRKVTDARQLTRRTSREGLLNGTWQTVHKGCTRAPSVANSHKSLCDEDCAEHEL